MSLVNKTDVKREKSARKKEKSVNTKQDGVTQSSRKTTKGHFKELADNVGSPSCSQSVNEDQEIGEVFDCETIPGELSCKACDGVFTDENDQLIECERCSKWVCLDCSGLSEAHYDVLNDKTLGARLHWFCSTCDVLAVKAVKTDNNIEEQCKQYMASFRSDVCKELRGEINDVKLSLKEKITDEVDRVNKRVDQEVEIVLQKIENMDNGGTASEERGASRLEEQETLLEEMKDREARKLNLVIFNLKESKKEDNEDRKKDDVEAMRTLLSSISEPLPFSRTVRLGKKGENTRPIRITMTTTANQHAVLKAAVKLRNSEEYKEVFINKDQTPMEQKNWKRLLDVRKKKEIASREAEEDVTWIIRKGRVVPGKPK